MFVGENDEFVVSFGQQVEDRTFVISDIAFLGAIYTLLYFFFSISQYLYLITYNPRLRFSSPYPTVVVFYVYNFAGCFYFCYHRYSVLSRSGLS